MVYLLHAVGDENGRATGGKAGDQTGREIRQSEWYDKPWTCVIRANKSRHSEKIAQTAQAIVDNNFIGYDQAQRTTLYIEAVKARYKIAKIETPCETDCSAMVAVCVNAAGIPVSKDMYTGNERELLQRTFKFEVFEDKKFTSKTLWLKRGDILLGKGHTAIVKNDGAVIRRELRVGSIGYEVKLIQEALTDLGYPCGAIDGEFGGKTRDAVEKYQRMHGLKADCVVGKHTTKELGLTWAG